MRCAGLCESQSKRSWLSWPVDQAEGIDVAAIEFVSNEPTLILMEKKKEGIYAMLDEELNVPKVDDGWSQCKHSMEPV